MKSVIIMTVVNKTHNHHLFDDTYVSVELVWSTNGLRWRMIMTENLYIFLCALREKTRVIVAYVKEKGKF